MNNKIVLDWKRRSEALANREEYFSKYSIMDKNGYFKRLVVGAPVIINIGGSYYYVDKLLQICISGVDSLFRFTREIKSSTPFGDKYSFVWRE